jgi:hypothetical protein
LGRVRVPKRLAGASPVGKIPRTMTRRAQDANMLSDAECDGETIVERLARSGRGLPVWRFPHTGK